MTNWKDTIDRAAAVCGSQAALADRLGIATSNMSAAKHCKRPLTAPQIEELARVLEADPGDLWELQEVANIRRRNPFKRAVDVISAAFLCVVLSMAENDAKAVAIGAKANPTPANTVHIVTVLAALFRGVMSAAWRRAFGGRGSIGKCFTTSPNIQAI